MLSIFSLDSIVHINLKHWLAINVTFEDMMFYCFDWFYLHVRSCLCHYNNRTANILQYFNIHLTPIQSHALRIFASLYQSSVYLFVYEWVLHDLLSSIYQIFSSWSIIIHWVSIILYIITHMQHFMKSRCYESIPSTTDLIFKHIKIMFHTIDCSWFINMIINYEIWL